MIPEVRGQGERDEERTTAVLGCFLADFSGGTESSVLPGSPEKHTDAPNVSLRVTVGEPHPPLAGGCPGSSLPPFSVLGWRLSGL